MKLLRFPILCAAALAASATSSPAALIFWENGGMAVGEAETFTSRTGTAGDNWTIKPGENSGTSITDGGPIVTNFRGSGYIQTLPDDLSAGSAPTIPPEVTYQIGINNPGTYQLYVRWDGNNTNGTLQGQSDSLFADIVELKDGTGGTIADWYELQQGVNGNFASPAWDAGGGFEQNVAGPANGAMTWTLTPGIYNLRFSQREDGAAIDAWVLQLNSLPAPTGLGPIISPEPGRVTLLAAGLAGMALRRRRQR